jgi:hypothetical protein
MFLSQPPSSLTMPQKCKKLISAMNRLKRHLLSVQGSAYVIRGLGSGKVVKEWIPNAIDGVTYQLISGCIRELETAELADHVRSSWTTYKRLSQWDDTDRCFSSSEQGKISGARTRSQFLSVELHLKEIDKFYKDIFAIDVLAAPRKTEGRLLVNEGVPTSSGTTRMLSPSIDWPSSHTEPRSAKVTADEEDDGCGSSEDGWTVVPSDFQAGK